MKRIVLCADDYGQAEAISQAILSLIEKRRLSATSCLVNTSYWQTHAKSLLTYKDQVDIGLHFNLTEGRALSRRYIEAHGEKLMPLRTLLTQAYRRKLDRDALEAELNSQIDAFISVANFIPHFIDGHQHVHQFPIVRDALINVYNQRLRQHDPYIRLVKGKIKFADLFNAKKLIIQATGVNALKRLLHTNSILHNASFAGIYSFANAQAYHQIFSRFLTEVEDGGLIMCHPGLSSFSSGDRIAKARFEEYQYISSSQFIADCHKYRISVRQFSSIFNQKNRE